MGHAATAQSTLGGGKAEMLHSYAKVEIGIEFPVVVAHPALGDALESHEIHGRSLEPSS